ncbi:uncharacterized membrane protein-like [Ostrea edulis]|uniref:uncharacterized membrane protein-like n=1 Tax=Ostrea edulis TaxID=37623 RepID=UPI0024AF79B5|nr:uncharacterized membrane protein-like [Ostrea edulis]
MVSALSFLLLIQILVIQGSPECHKECDKGIDYCISKECYQKTGSDLAECKRECHGTYWECCQCISECEHKESKCNQECKEKQKPWEKAECERECKREISNCHYDCVHDG